jgi:hypothetical protein
VTNPAALILSDPLDLDDAREAARALSRQRREAERFHERLTEEAAAAERSYRKAYAEAFVKATGTAAEREAKARSEASDAAYARDLKAGMVKVAAERLRGLEGERSMLKTLMEWSARVLEQGTPDGQVFGRRAA